MNIKPWKLLHSTDASPSPWLPVEKRTYQLPNKTIIDDFYVVTLADSVHVIPITPNGQIILIRMYKPGIDEIILQFPAGRIEATKHKSPRDAAIMELEEETGAKCQPAQFQKIAELGLATTKATEKIHLFLAQDVVINSTQKLDTTEQIEVVTLSPQEIESYIAQGKIKDAACIANWQVAKAKGYIL